MPKKPPSSTMDINHFVIVGGLLIIFCAVAFLAVVLWSTTQPKLQKRDKEISSITTCQTEGVVCK